MSDRTAQAIHLATRDPKARLTKSWMVGSDLCGWRGWYDLWDPKPFRMTEPVAFGKAVDAGVELIISAARSGQMPDLIRSMAAAKAAVEDLDIELDWREVDVALFAFQVDVLPKFDWSYCETQARFSLDIEGVGPVEGHPDIVLRDGTVLDVKTAARAKPENAAATAYLELGFYALMVEAMIDEPVPAVGYITWTRTKAPRWQIVTAPVTDTMRRISLNLAAGKARMRKADADLNRQSAGPENWVMTNGPRYAGLCNDCAHAPWNGGGCVIADREE